MNDKSPRRRGRERSLSDAFQGDSLLKSVLKSLGRTLGKFVLSLAFCLLVIGALIIGAGVPFDTGSVNDTAPEEPQTVVVSDVNYSTVYENVTPSVVSVYANGQNGTSSQGSGFVYDTHGHIVTNWHVISGNENIDVRYNNGEWASAELVGSDPYTDLAVLKVASRPDSAQPLPVTAETPHVGERVLALGSPDDLRGSLSTGAVSGVNRSMTTPQGFVIPDMVQTDASLNPGNSGGPLVGMDGTVLGVNRARQGENLGFAISGRIVHTIVPSIIEDGEHRHSLVGIRGTTMSPTVADANEMELRSGILVTEASAGGPSDDVLQGGSGENIEYNGFEVADGGDLIIEIDGTPITTNEALTSYLMRNTQPGDTVEFTIIRDGEQQTVSVILGERPVYGG